MAATAPSVREEDIAADFSVSESCSNGWLKAADDEVGIQPGVRRLLPELDPPDRARSLAQ